MRAAVVALPALLPVAALACTTSGDCELNGACVGGGCRCEPQWKGRTCGELNLLPAPRHGGLHLENYSTWGGSVAHDDETGLYTMFVSRIAEHCDLSGWYPNSEIMRATSASPLGPFELDPPTPVLSSFAHGPTVHRASPGDGGWLLFHIGCGAHQGPLHNCSSRADQLAPATEGQGYCTPDWIAVSHAASLSGPWDQHGPLVNATEWTWFGGGVTNPAPFVFDNGTVLMLYRGHKPEKLGASVAPSFKGPYHAVGPVPLLADSDEDPYIWRSRDGVFHGVTHWMGHASGSLGGGRHIWSLNGIDWNVSSALAFRTLVEWDDGSTQQLTSRERPQLLIEEGVPKVLYTGVQPTGRHLRGSTFTMAQGINQQVDLTITLSV